MRRLVTAIVTVMFGAVALGGSATAQAPCPRAVIFTLPAVTWGQVERVQPPNLLEVMREGAAAEMAVRTNSSRTSHASGFVTIGAGTRTDGGRTAGYVADEGIKDGLFSTEVRAGGFDEIVEGAQEADYIAEPGALASALNTETIAIGNAAPTVEPISPWGGGLTVLLASSDTSGVTDRAAVGPDLLVADASAPFGLRSDQTALQEAVDGSFSEPCAAVFIDQGDLIRADTWSKLQGAPDLDAMDQALVAADELLGYVSSKMNDDDLLLVIAPTSPWADPEVHLGVAVARGPGFPPGSSMESASTRQAGFVTLPDVAPTVLDFFDIERPSSMLGRPFVAIDGRSDMLGHLADLDEESVFAHGIQTKISTTFVIVQLIVYVLALLFLARRQATTPLERQETVVTWLRRIAFCIVAFPFATYLATPIPARNLGLAWFVVALIAIDVAVVGVVSRFLRDPLERLLAITGATILMFILDLAFFKALQLNAVWGNDPIVAGRFTGLGNIAFAILGSSSLMTGALLVHRFLGRRWVFWVVAVLFGLTVVVDGAPQLGSDVGGVLALVPALGVTFLLLLGQTPSLKLVALTVLGAMMALGLFLAVDLSRPPESRTHLARLVEDVQGRGIDAFTEALGRKIRTNIRVFRSTIWTYLVPPALGVIAWLLLRPKGRWHDMATSYPRLRAGLIGGLILATLGFAVNDSGIVVPAMVLSFLVPMSLILHVVMERDRLSERGNA